jgi:phosphatidylglycerol lysyltransferase
MTQLMTAVKIRARGGPVIESGGKMDADAIARLEAMAFEHRGSYDSYLVMDLDREYFWLPGYEAVLGFVMRGSHAVVIGGLIGPEDSRERLLKAFMEHCRVGGLKACFGNVAQRDVGMFDRNGFESTKIGEDAVIGLRGCTWQGKAYEWVRRQTSYGRRHGMVCVEIGEGEKGRFGELEEISNGFLDRSPHGHTMKYFVGRFDPEGLYRRRVFAAIGDGGVGRVEGFVVCTPYRDGAAWAIEMYRSRGDAVRGTMPFLMHQAMKVFAGEGVEEASLCLMPAAHCGDRRAGDSWFIHAYIRMTHQYLNFIFDTPGIYHFKTRFRPECESRYCSVWPRGSVGALHAILSTWGTLEFSLWKAMARGVRRLGVWGQRGTLVES